MFHTGGRHGSVRLRKAVGSRCANAVAIRTPVPKWRAKKRKEGGIRRRGKRFAISGNAHAGGVLVCVKRGEEGVGLPNVL